MLKTIFDMLPRLTDHTKSLSNTKMFTDKSWLLPGDTTSNNEYFFDKNGQLKITTNGIVTEGTWAFSPDSGEMNIEQATDKLCLKPVFLSKGAFIMKKTGADNTLLVWYNPEVVKDGNVETYLRKYLAGQELRRYNANDVIEP